jgi:hypothetical protein
VDLEAVRTATQVPNGLPWWHPEQVNHRPGDAGAQLESLAQLLRERNVIDSHIGDLLGRPMTSGHAGEWIAARVFDIQLEASASAAAIDGKFRSGPLAGRTTNVKWYLKREGLLDMTTAPQLEYYLVLAGPKGTVRDPKTLRPWVIRSVHLFDAAPLLAEQAARNVKVGVASSVTETQWTAADIYPIPRNPPLVLTQSQRDQLALFSR